MSDQPCFITLLSIELLIPYAQSLKDKRSAVLRLKDRVRSKFNASVAEVAFQDKWQRAVLAVCMVGSDKRKLESDTDRLRQLCDEEMGIEIAAFKQEWL